MQFVKNGPDIPERLLQLHEDGQVVFFCGAGISFPARLPGFSSLVEKLYQSLSVTPDDVQKSAIKAKQFDTAIGLLEADFVGGRGRVRAELERILTPDLTSPGATATHEALLTLAKNHNGYTRLITTNFDHLFEKVKSEKSLAFTNFKAPLLPVPKTRWDGLVYLHGLLPFDGKDGDLDQLVLSSGDFGLAYLTERWASRFVSELFRNYTICFVGYSINDPVLRYMMDALNADRQQGEFPREMFAFGSYSKGKESHCTNEWKAKNVTPILYREHRHHAYLHRTLQAWAKTYRDNVSGKEQIVTQSAYLRPLASSKQDDFVGRMLWALSEPTGLPAQRFAELDPVPSLDWLEPFDEKIYSQVDLIRFGVLSEPVGNDELSYSLINRPSPHPLAPWMNLVNAGQLSSNWDEVMKQIANWLIRHLDDPKLMLWLVKRGGQLHAELIRLIENRLNELIRLENDGQNAELNRIKANAPNAIPRNSMRTLWRLLINGNVRSELQNQDLYRWHRQFRQYGLTASVRLFLRETLMPCLSLRAPFQPPRKNNNDEINDSVRSIVDWEVVLASHYVHSGIRDIKKDENWNKALPELLEDFNTLLRDVLDLMRELGGANSESDCSYIYHPSISHHSQNEDFYDWTVLIELNRDAWLATAAQSPERAKIIAELWANGVYPTFRRLALFAATQENVIPHRKALDWLLSDEQRWLWSIETRREAVRLLTFLAPRLNKTMLTELESAILSGPPRYLYPPDIDLEDWNQNVDRSVWLRLAKITQAGALLNPVGKTRLDALSEQYPWQLSEDESDEFPFWRGRWIGGNAPGESFIPIPRRRRGVLEYLFDNPNLEETQRDDWRELCSEMFQATTYALCKLSKRDSWPNERWRDAFQAWSTEKLRVHSWHFMGPIVANAPNDFLEATSYEISWWLQSVAQTFEEHEEQFLTLVRRILELDYEDDRDTDDFVFHAINHPVGHVTQALLDWWYRQNPDDKQGIPESIEPIFINLCDTEFAKFRHGRVLLATHIITLYRVDQNWTTQHLLPLFDWNHSETEAQAAWEGFLLSPRFYRPLVEAIKPELLETVNHYSQLGKYNKQFATFLTFVALDPADTFKTGELASAIRSLPIDGLEKSAQTLVMAQESAGDQREDYWENRVLPFWNKLWPKSNNHLSSNIAESLALLCLATGNKFPSAMDAVDDWLQAINDPNYVIRKLKESDQLVNFPQYALRLLFIIINDSPLWLSGDLRQCLDIISQEAPSLCNNPFFSRVDNIARKLNV